MTKETILPVVIKNHSKSYCPMCNADIHGMGTIDNCPQCGQAVEWQDGVSIDMCAMETFEAQGKTQVLECFGMDLAKGEDFSVRTTRRNNKLEVVNYDKI